MHEPLPLKIGKKAPMRVSEKGEITVRVMEGRVWEMVGMKVKLGVILD